MACGCSRSKTYTYANPLVIGDADGREPRQFRTTVAMFTLRAGATFYATGSGLDAMVAAGWLVLVS